MLVEFNGAIDLSYRNWEEEGERGGNSFFDVHEVYLLANVDIAEDVLSYFEVRYEHITEEIAIRQGYIDWNIADPVTFRAGFFYFPLGAFHRNYCPTTRQFVTYPYSMRLVNVTPWGDAGVQIKGGTPNLEL